MKHELFIGLFARRAHLGDDEVERAAGAVLETLTERLTPGEVDHLLEQMPVELAVWLHRVAGRTQEPFDVDEFLRRVAARDGEDIETAELHARALFAVLRDVLPPDEFADLVADLPEDFGPIVWNLAVTPADEIVGEVARRAQLDEVQARRATDAVFETLAERLSGGEVGDLISRLPVELHEPLRKGAARDRDAARLTVEEFVARVADREAVGADAARPHVQAVLGALREAIGGEEFADVEAELPPDYAPLIPMPC